ncbi:MAG: hypothetical protein AAGE92_15435, partial [Cyanobacteria bacterium P01_G01_bin.4]
LDAWREFHTHGEKVGGYVSWVQWGWKCCEQPLYPIVQTEWAEGYQFGAEVYVESCGSCHTALPPEVMPRETWRVLLQSEEHYGVNIDAPQGPFLQAAWGFMQDFSRARNQFEEVPYRLDDSRYFRALHPQVEFAETIRPTGCIDCHPRANLGNFVSLSDEWQ